MCVQAVPARKPAPESLLAATELSNPVQALMAILGSDATSQEPCLPSTATIRHMLMHTVQLCTAAFARSPTAISTTIKPLTHLALASQLPKAPFPPATSIWVPTGHSAGRAQPSSPVPLSLLHNRMQCRCLVLWGAIPAPPSLDDQSGCTSQPHMRSVFSALVAAHSSLTLLWK